MIHARLCRAGQAPVEQDGDLLEMARVADGELLWLNVEAPSDDELQQIVGSFGIDLNAVEERVERLEEQLLRQPGRAALDEATLMKRHVLTSRRLVAPPSRGVRCAGRGRHSADPRR